MTPGLVQHEQVHLPFINQGVYWRTSVHSTPEAAAAAYHTRRRSCQLTTGKWSYSPPSYFSNPIQGYSWVGAYPSESHTTPWTGHQSTRGLTYREKRLFMFIHTKSVKLPSMSLDCAFVYYLFPLPLLLTRTDETSSSLLLHLQECNRSGASCGRAEARTQRCSDASGAVSTSWWRSKHQGGSGARWGAQCGGSEGIWPLDAVNNARASGAGRQGPGVCTEVSTTLFH